ncbi:hypothetical protein CANMA_001614 [Candida margitis]|uniref:uncharacterized protein n=1 Tax=Candida margitis TaxID=1775924 RepID=UPI0022276F84|nr:uncharacterized protein CANMA_001614 [Candida margitis]KAI5969294.1 hypothetical protein CANMA_001614 [Candida margitis]
MKLSETLFLAVASAGLIKAETDTTITQTITITKTLYTPEESLSMAEEAASIASVLAAESLASVVAVQSAVEGYYSSLASASEALLAEETSTLENKGYNATNNLTITYVTVTVKPKSTATSSALPGSDNLVLEVENDDTPSDLSSSEAVTIPAESASEDAGFKGLDERYSGTVAGLCALVAALL